MPPKRKSTSTSTPSASETPTQRATRSNNKASASSATPSTTKKATATKSTPKPKPAPKPKAAPKAKATTKAKKKELTPVELSDSDEEEQAVNEAESTEDERPAPKKAKVAKATASSAIGSNNSKIKKEKSASGSKKATKAPAKAKTSAKVNPRATSSVNSASTPVYEPEPAPPSPPHHQQDHDSAPTAKTKPASMPPRRSSTDEEFNTWFKQFADEDEPDKMGHEGIEALFDQMGLDMNGVLPFVLAWKINGKPGSFGTYYKDELKRGMKLEKITNSDKLKSFLVSSEQELYSKTPQDPDMAKLNFRSFYEYVFKFLKDEGQKSLEGQTALVAIGIVLAPKYPLASQFVSYGEELGPAFKGVSSDVWQQLLAFCDSVDDSLEGYSEYDAWPTVIDSFVEWKKEHK